MQLNFGNLVSKKLNKNHIRYNSAQINMTHAIPVIQLEPHLRLLKEFV